jgi:hypothetical protein
MRYWLVTVLQMLLEHHHAALGFRAADTDCSGCIDLKEFKHLIGFVQWLNEELHTVQDIQAAFAEGALMIASILPTCAAILTRKTTMIAASCVAFRSYGISPLV